MAADVLHNRLIIAIRAVLTHPVKNASCLRGDERDGRTNDDVVIPEIPAPQVRDDRQERLSKSTHAIVAVAIELLPRDLGSLRYI